MKRFRNVVLLAVLLLSIGWVLPAPSSALTVHTSTPEPTLEGTEISITLTLVSTGVEQESEAPLGTSTVSVGESVDLGRLETGDARPAQLRVELPDDAFYRNVRPDELERGEVDLTIPGHGPVENLSVEQRSVLVQPFPNRLMVREVVVFQNGSDVRIGGADEPIEIDLPDGATRLNPGPGFSGEGDYRVEGDKLQYRVQLTPGRSIVGFFYIITPDGDRHRMVRKSRWPTDRFLVNTMSHDSVTVTTEGFRSIETEQEAPGPGGNADQYVAESVSPGTALSITWSGLESMSMPSGMPGGGAEAGPAPGPREENTSREASTESSSPRPNVWSSVSWPVLLAIGISLLVFAGSYGYVQFYLKGSADQYEDLLIEEIARLDQEYEDGAIEEPYYRRTRRRWKQYAEQFMDDQPSQTGISGGEAEDHGPSDAG